MTRTNRLASSSLGRESVRAAIAGRLKIAQPNDRTGVRHAKVQDYSLQDMTRGDS